VRLEQQHSVITGRNMSDLALVFLQVGMRYFNKRTNKYHNPIVNLDKLWTLVGEEVGDTLNTLHACLHASLTTLRASRGWCLRAHNAQLHDFGFGHCSQVHAALETPEVGAASAAHSAHTLPTDIMSLHTCVLGETGTRGGGQEHVGGGRH